MRYMMEHSGKGRGTDSGFLGHQNVTMSRFGVFVGSICDNVTFCGFHDRPASSISVSAPFSPLFGRVGHCGEMFQHR